MKNLERKLESAESNLVYSNMELGKARTRIAELERMLEISTTALRRINDDAPGKYHIDRLISGNRSLLEGKQS